MKRYLSRLIAITLITLIALSMLAACSSAVQRTEDSIKSLVAENKGKYYFEKVSDSETLENIKTELEYRINTRFNGKILSYMIFADKKTDAYCAVVIFDNENDAKLIENNSSPSFKNDYIVRKGMTVVYGNEDMVKLVLPRV